MNFNMMSAFYKKLMRSTICFCYDYKQTIPMHKNNYTKHTTITATEFAKQLHIYEINNETYEKIISICNNKELEHLKQLIDKNMFKIVTNYFHHYPFKTWHFIKYISNQEMNNFIMDVLEYNLLKHNIFASDFKIAFNELKFELEQEIAWSGLRMCSVSLQYNIANMLAKQPNLCAINTMRWGEFLPVCKYYTVLSINKIFYNNHCYDEFFTIQNIKKYISFIITKQCKYVGHMKTFLKIVCDYMNEQTNMIFYSYMIREMKKENNIEMHHVLCDFPLYVDYTDKYFKKQKEKFIFICDKIYDNYHANVTGNRVVADEYVLKCIAKFL